MNENDLLAWLADERSESLADVLASLRGQGEDETERILGILAANADPVVRAWSATAAARTLGGRAPRLISPLLDDHDPDVRDLALEELRRLDLSLVARELPRLRKKLQSDDIHEPVVALWTVAELGATALRDDVVKVVREPHEPFHARVAEVVLAVLDRDERAITSRLEAHDHIAVPWLVKAARVLGSPGARQAVEAVAATAPDDECRNFAREGSECGTGRDSHHQASLTDARLRLDRPTSGNVV